MDTMRYVSAILLALVLISCEEVKIMHFTGRPTHMSSMGGHVDISMVAERGFIWQYDNSIEFDRELTISVDSAFARLHVNDGDLKRAVDDFRMPAYRLLSDKYKIQLLWGEIEADPKSRKFVLKTEKSPWPPDDVGPLNSPLLEVPASKPYGNRYRWRAKIVKAEVEFNSFSPKKVKIHAEMLVELQEHSPEGKWKNIQSISSRATDMLADSLRKDLNLVYHRYLKDRYGLGVKFVAID